MKPSFDDLEELAAFEPDGRPVLSVYLDLTTVDKRESVVHDFEALANQRLQGSGLSRRQRRALREDIEIVQMYLNNGALSQSAGLAIFSCASRLFWRVYSLSVAVSSRMDVGPTFNLEPLKRAIKKMERQQELLIDAG